MSANEPAYPVLDASSCQYSGLTKRELFVLEMAKAARISSPQVSSAFIAEQANRDANALLAQLSTEPT